MSSDNQFDDIQKQLESIKQQISELKTKCSSSAAGINQPEVESVSESVSESVNDQPVKDQPVKDVPASTDETTNNLSNVNLLESDYKFKRGDGFPPTFRLKKIIDLIDNTNKRGKRDEDTKKNAAIWNSIRQELMEGKSVDDVQRVINKYDLRFSNSYIGGKTRKRRGVGKKRRNTHKRR